MTNWAIRLTRDCAHAFAALRGVSRVDLLIAPNCAAATWDAATPGIVLNSHLSAIVWESPPDFKSLWEESRDDIGTEPPELDKMPPSPREGSNSISAQVGRSLLTGLAGLTYLVAKLVPSGASHPTWVNKLEDWANRKKTQIAVAREAARNREIARLLHLLGTQPDEGLRFALPLSAIGSRGVATPSNRLGPRDVNFNLKRLGGGRPADAWNIDDSYRRQLSVSYRELANREIRLGRHRRAAYIFGELLGDFVSAAKVLDDGQHFREAVVLYEERLHQPRAAAECLERGGLWAEAIAIFTRLKEYERVGKIHRQLNQEEEAQFAYRLAVDARLSSRDYVGAAELLERELNATDEALEQLKAGWHDGNQSARCFTEAFRLFAQHGWHEDAGNYVRELRKSLSDAKVVTFANGLAEIAASYPESELRLIAGDHTRTLAAERLPSLSQQECIAVLAAVGRLVPGDRLLRHDIRRFVEQRFPRRAVQTLAKPSKDKIRFVRRIELPSADWQTAVALDDCFVAAGWHGQELTVVRAAWDGSIDRPVHGMWRIAVGGSMPPIMLSADPQGLHSILVHAVGERPVTGRRCFVPREKFPEGVAIGSHPGLSIESVALGYGGRGTAYIVELSANELVVNAYAAMSDSLLNSWSIELDGQPKWSSLPVPFFARDGAVYLGIGNVVSKWTPVGKIDEFACPSTVRSLCGSLPHTRLRTVAALEQGGMIIWDTPGDTHHVLFAEGMFEPVVGLTRAGWLVAAAKNQLQVYATKNRMLALHSKIETPADDPIAILGTRQENQFAICTRQGAVLLYEAIGG